MNESGGTLPFTVDLPYVLARPAGIADTQPTPLVIALHGMGQTPALMRRVMGALLEQPWTWLFPRGPWPYEIRRAEGTKIGYAWYVFDGDQQGLRAGLDQSANHICALHDVIRSRVAISRTAIVGFSQGGYLAGYAGPRNPQRFAGAACISGRIKHEFLADTRSKSTALAQIHGALDVAVKADAARDAVEKTRALGFADVTYFEDPNAGHEITPPMLDTLGQWLRRIL